MIELQQKLLADHGRNDAFYKALQSTIKKGISTVSDIGSGTGFLSFLASQLGAKKCYLYEADEDILALSKKLALKNKITNCVLMHGYSDEVKDPTRTDIVISETLGNYALEEHIIEIFQDAQRFLKKGGHMIPAQVQQFVAPVTAPRIHDEITAWDHVGYKLDFSPAKEAALNNMYVYRITADELNGTPQCWDTIDLTANPSSKRAGNAEWSYEKPTTVYGFCIWWTAHLTKDILLTTDPHHTSTHWDQIYLPLMTPLTLAADETCSLKLSSDTSYNVGVRLTWEIRTSSSKAVIKMDTAKGIR
ncbi:50S ribosomal protein L11 methyltransferase [Candidatus Gracilibacteria bacterium]|nr:50S ribosomal protein L11 methyltransferase [Candidatus Gracilibacteria bacterium]